MRLITITLMTCVFFTCNAQNDQITFNVDMSGYNPESVTLRGSISPLGWNKDYPMQDEDGDGIYTAIINFKTSKNRLQYLFAIDGDVELVGSDKRALWFSKEHKAKVVNHVFDRFDYLSSEQLATATFTPEQIDEDITVFKETIEFIHPSLYKYTDSSSMESKWATLREEMLAEPTLINAYKAISKFAVNVKCSHTFTNPWNQTRKIEKAIFYQPDKLPFTFTRIGKRLFIDKNASESTELRRGKEILSINGYPTETILNRLATYIASDGDNYEKRLQRLTLSGTSKFDLFDIFFPLEFGSTDEFEIQLQDVLTGEITNAKVKAMSKTSRSSILRKRYSDFGNTFEDGWKFKFIEDEVAYLRVDNFSVFSTDFNWKKFLDDSFASLRKRNPANLIIDIRANEGGNDDVAAYILERLITSPISIEIPAPITNYKKIPDHIRKHISTWDNRPYDWGDKISSRPNGQYELKKLYSARTRNYKPKGKGFQGKTYLMVGAENSSATHLMATYFKKYELATLVGQETGGNQRGLNGGQIFFHRLPNTRVEIDIPIFQLNVLSKESNPRNGGVIPDIVINKNPEDLVNGIDTELTSLLEMIKEK